MQWQIPLPHVIELLLSFCVFILIAENNLQGPFRTEAIKNENDRTNEEKYRQIQHQMTKSTALSPWPYLFSLSNEHNITLYYGYFHEDASRSKIGWEKLSKVFPLPVCIRHRLTQPIYMEREI